MSIKTASVTPKAIKLKSPSGLIFETTSVLFTAVSGEAVFSFTKPYSALSDDGLWEIYSADKNQISDVAGNFLVSNEKLGEFVVGETDDAIAKADAEIAALKAKQDAQAESLQKTTQSVADLAILVASGAGGSSSVDLKLLQDKLTALDTAKAEKTALDTLDTTVTALKIAIADGATDKDLADAIAKVDAAIALIESSLKPLVGRKVYTSPTVLNAIVGDEIHIDGEGDIQLAVTPADGAEVRVFDPERKIKTGKNNLLLGSSDRWLMPDGSFDATSATFTDNQLLGGWARIKYSAPTKSWSPYVVYGSIPSNTGTGAASVQHDIVETQPLPISSTPSVQFHLEGGAGAWIDTNLPDGWWGTVLNTTNQPQPIAFDDDDLMVFVRDGGPIDAIESPYQVPGNSSVTLQMVENGFKFLQIIPNGGTASKAVGGDRVAIATLALLPANQWTDWPALTGADASNPISLDRIESSTGEDFSNRLEVQRVSKQVRSLTEHQDLKFIYEVHGATAADGGDYLVKAVLVLLPANQWVNWPALSGADAGKALSLDHIESSTGEDWTIRLELNRVSQQVRSLTAQSNVQFVYEVH